MQSKKQDIRFYELLSPYTSAESAPSRKEAEQHKVLKDRFSHIHNRIFLKYPHILRKIWLVYKKIYSFKTASHLTANKFFVDFGVAGRSKV